MVTKHNRQLAGLGVSDFFCCSHELFLSKYVVTRIMLYVVAGTAMDILWKRGSVIQGSSDILISSHAFYCRMCKKVCVAGQTFGCLSRTVVGNISVDAQNLDQIPNRLYPRPSCISVLSHWYGNSGTP